MGDKVSVHRNKKIFIQLDSKFQIMVQYSIQLKMTKNIHTALATTCSDLCIRSSPWSVNNKNNFHHNYVNYAKPP